MTFQEAIEIVLTHEGGYVNHPNDPGGETNFGITKRNYPDLDIRNLTRDQAKAIYENDYWNRNGIGNLPDAIRLQLFDMAVNMGAKSASTVLQKALSRMLNEIVGVDGVVGAKTMQAVSTAISRPKELNLWIAHERKNYYVALVLRRPQMSVFLKGWIARTDDVLDKAISRY